MEATIAPTIQQISKRITWIRASAPVPPIVALNWRTVIIAGLTP